jgi:hypothetical protein
MHVFLHAHVNSQLHSHHLPVFDFPTSPESSVSAAVACAHVEHEVERNTVDISRWQPDSVLSSWKLEKIAILELTQPSGMFIVQM